jgi:serine/threonine protein kinase
MSSSSKSKESKHDVETDEKEVDELMVVLGAYNQAESIFEDLEKKKVKTPEPLKFTYFDDTTTSLEIGEKKIDDEDVASETESLKSFGDSDEEDNFKNSEEGQAFIDRIVFQFHEDFIISSCLMNKWDRKVYTAIRIKDQMPVIIIVANDNVKRLRRNDMPREVRIMKHLKGQENVADILGWCPVDKRHYVIVMKYYENCDIISASKGNLYIVSKIMKSILTGVKNIHDSKVAHRDLSKDNILWNPVTEQATIIDFDTACFFRPRGYFRDVGRDKYDAPEKTEVIELRKQLWAEYDESGKKPKSTKRMKSYTEKADIYSLGVLFWMLINDQKHSPEPPKLKKWITRVRQKNKQKKYPELDLLLRMLNFDPTLRINVSEALLHPFIVNIKDEEDKKSEDFTHYTEMKKYLRKMINNEDDDDEDDEDDQEHDIDLKYPDDEEENGKDTKDPKQKDDLTESKTIDDDDDLGFSESESESESSEASN